LDARVGCVNSIQLQMNTLRASADPARASTLARPGGLH
jgi:hypothetical protein